MSKRLARMAENPRAGWTIEDVAALCREFDIACAPPRGGGSHYKISHEAMPEILTLPFKRPIKPVYSKACVVRRSREDGQMSQLCYQVIVSPLSEQDGGGFIATVPDLPGCMSDGETPEEALTNVQDAIDAWLESARDLGRPIPPPSRVAAIA